MVYFICLYKKALFGSARELQKPQWTGYHIPLNAYICFYKTDLTRFPLYSFYKRNPEGTVIYLFKKYILSMFLCILKKM